MRFHFNFILLILLCSSTALANNKVGNGGNIVVCEATNKKAENISLLDFYENFESLEKFKGSTTKIAEQRLAMLKSISPKLGDQYLQRFKSIWGEIEFRDDIELTEIKDSHHLFVPKDCTVKQIAIRRKQALGDEKRFLFRKDLWEKLGSQNQAGLIMHEIIYEHLSKLGEEDSTKVRRLNRMLFSKNVSANEFWKLIKDLELPIYPTN